MRINIRYKKTTGSQRMMRPYTGRHWTINYGVAKSFLHSRRHYQNSKIDSDIEYKTAYKKTSAAVCGARKLPQRRSKTKTTTSVRAQAEESVIGVPFSISGIDI